MLIKILYSLLLPTFLVVPFLYRNKRPAMLDFYCNMAMSFAFRKVYTRMLLLFLLAFHFYHLTIFRNYYDLIPSSMLCFAMFSHPLCERCIYFLQERRILGLAWFSCWRASSFHISCLSVFPSAYSFAEQCYIRPVCSGTYYSCLNGRTDRTAMKIWWRFPNYISSGMS